MEVYSSDDYAGMEFGGITFYFGYEYQHKFKPEYEDAEMEETWGFYVEKDKKVIFNISLGEMMEIDGFPENEDDCCARLLFGMGLYFERAGVEMK